MHTYHIHIIPFGAALLATSGKVYTGCNIENFGIMSICAERVAFCKAISEGEKEFEKIVICAGKEGEDKLENAMPCGYCRQFMLEFVDKNFKVVVLNNDGKKEFALQDLLPHSFSI